MSLASVELAETDFPEVLEMPASPRPLHRLAEVRRLQGVSRRTVARRLATDVTRIRCEERESTDLLLSRLYAWQNALEVPITELLVESSDELSDPIERRAQLVRVMKTALAILEQAEQTPLNRPLNRMAQTLVDQLLGIMPELEGIGPWHSVGQRRRRDELGVAAQRCLPDEMFLDMFD
ncbi:MAG: hypothetical protein ACOCWL_01120 [Thermoguttaceae bacterium]